ncbi:hypothetical protein CVD28_22410 [Bacillus sp. M6-12]|uniref:DUF2268 domain-containing protein n=1 Tax=Bacillus sp. M6-12 TaxID=2054166 RepID=UPI000C75E76D|nr:DUF2268 domain-containing putative Zn-dependent protease [Bacillus sp. M6-12]PLS15471.1 hypothetical protein CVD28_22410 [Bacillus sp. M6-12]
MAVINTFEWLERKEVSQKDICSYFQELLNEENPRRLYSHLRNHGMYIEQQGMKRQLEGLMKRNVWELAAKFLHSYQSTWKGPDIPVLIFPLQPKGIFSRRMENKSGLAFRDKLFLFLNPSISDKELEALFVHEYHHVCRLNTFKKNEEDYTLLDAMVMEGLAEQAVKEHVGPEYLAKWTSLYNEKTIRKLYEPYLKNNLHVKNNDPLHDELLYGTNGKPIMLGYCTGYTIVNCNKEIKNLDSFRSMSKVYLNEFLKHAQPDK